MDPCRKGLSTNSLSMKRRTRPASFHKSKRRKAFLCFSNVFVLYKDENNTRPVPQCKVVFLLGPEFQNYISPVCELTLH